jgi:hypothetical protein
VAAGGRYLLSDDGYRIRATSTETGETVPVLLRGSSEGGEAEVHLKGTHARFIPTGHLAFISLDGNLMLAPFDIDRLVALGSPEPLVLDLRREGGIRAGQYDVSADGDLVYVAGADGAMVRFVLASPREGVDTLPIRAAAYQRFDISPDGLRIAGVVEGLEGSELWVFDTQSGSQQKWIAALESMVFMEPSWAPGGTRLAIGVQNRDRLTEGFVLMGSPDLGNPPDTLSKLLAWQVVFAQDGQDLLATDGDKIWTMRPEPGAPTTEYADPQGVPFALALSPDERWLAYSSNESGTYEVYLERYPQTGPRPKASSEGGLEPLWLSPSELVYRLGLSWLKTTIDPSTGQPLGAPEPFFEDPAFLDTPGISNRAGPDRKILYLRGPDEKVAHSMRVITNWVHSLSERATGEGRR